MLHDDYDSSRGSLAVVIVPLAFVVVLLMSALAVHPSISALLLLGVVGAAAKVAKSSKYSIIF